MQLKHTTKIRSTIKCKKMYQISRILKTIQNKKKDILYSERLFVFCKQLSKHDAFGLKCVGLFGSHTFNTFLLNLVICNSFLQVLLTQYLGIFLQKLFYDRLKTIAELLVNDFFSVFILVSVCRNTRLLYTSSCQYFQKHFLFYIFSRQVASMACKGVKFKIKFIPNNFL